MPRAYPTEFNSLVELRGRGRRSWQRVAVHHDVSWSGDAGPALVPLCMYRICGRHRSVVGATIAERRHADVLAAIHGEHAHL